MKAILKVEDFNKERQKHFQGILVSLFDILDDILMNRVRSTKISHLFRERLKKDEKRMLSILFNNIIDQNCKGDQKVPIEGSVSPLRIPLPETFKQTFEFFRKVSD
jgi:hypothetical protein